MITEFLIKKILSEILLENRVSESVIEQNLISYYYKELLCEALLFGEPLTIKELRDLLRKKILHFEFVKLDGTVRDVKKATLMMKHIPQSAHPKGIRPSNPTKVATWYDLTKHDWRSTSVKSKEIVLKQI